MAANGYGQASSGGDLQYSATSHSQSPPHEKPNNNNQAVHQRTYQACIPCRQRKVRCDLGSVDNPHDPPCTRCRREAKECYFSATRRKKKNGSGENTGSEAGEDAAYEARHQRKRLRTSAPPESEYGTEAGVDERPRTPGGSLARSQPLPRPQPPKPVHYDEEDMKKADETVAMIQHAPLHGGHDALNLLYRAAVHPRTTSTTSSHGRPALNGQTSAGLPSAFSPTMDKVRNGSYTSGPMGMFQEDSSLWRVQTDGPNVANGSTEPVKSDGVKSAERAWSRFKFVRAGWFTSKEGIDYVLYFYKHLSPLTPVVIPDFRDPATHKRLLEEEPMLAVTMLLIASRHMSLEGPGSNSRPMHIHNKLWTYLSGMIDRVVWGQEQFGGGFCGAGAQPSCDVHPLTRKGLRTLGSIESLILLTEWHPRAMHFPPDEDDDDLMMPDQSFPTPAFEAENVPKGIGGHRMDAWLEPCWRSDRMCWMLLGMAMSLAMEIGVFDSSESQRHARSADGGLLSAEDLAAYDKRRNNVRDLLLIYVTLTSGRLGLTSMLPIYYSKPEDSALFKKQVGQQDSVQDITLHFWLRMASLMREGNQKIFANKNFTRDLIRNGTYKEALDRLQEPLKDWLQEFSDCSVIPKHMKSILTIEYEYCRVYLNALGLQAVAERCANDQPSPPTVLDPPFEMARSALAANGTKHDAIAPHTLSKWLGGDRHYLQTVGDAARNLLKVVVEDLYPDGFLKHAPVRTYFRIISVAIMLLKSFSMGATESDISDSLTLMDRTVDALRTCIVDDVHVASRFADLLHTLTDNLKPRLVRIAAGDGRQAKSRRVGQNPSMDGADSSRPTSAPQHALLHRTQSQQGAQMSAGAVAPHQQWNAYTNNFLPPSTAMQGVNYEAYDLSGQNNAYSVMPPPGFSTSSPTNTNGNVVTPGYDGSFTHNNFGGSQDWFALPLDPLLDMQGADVNQTMYGPDIGGHDMLELLLSGNGNNGNGFQ
ncbi:hypothetical protein DOTSEDRAFT_41728 [Dothistroma septosporum NZE10]|uniref:Zn(2)-C6 fungal-type domain-containing protein n=1 Tax=Dothistroma septosporum (strain NZE10 / CBS 128990) TaxID=675120 RepID=N1PVA1_DOTSN|nr:hypothetical protein DOTSEDRAFT_41728 [Dothistroma septosporum NZE10]